MCAPLTEVADIRFFTPAGYLRTHSIATLSGSAMLCNLGASGDGFSIDTAFD